MRRAFRAVGWLLVLAVVWPRAAFAMHIMEGFLPPMWCLVWAVPTAVMVAFGLISINRQIKDNPKLKMMLALSAAYAFVLSALKIPSVTGSCSHPTEAILEIADGYEPWAAPLFEPPSGEIESLLFGLQAAIGAGFIGYFIAYSKFRKERAHEA